MVQHVDICVSCMIYKYTGHFHYLIKQYYCKQEFIYLLFPSVCICGKAILHDCRPRLETFYGFDSRGSSHVTRDVTYDVWRRNFQPIRVTSETATAKKEDQWKKCRGHRKKAAGAQVVDAYWALLAPKEKKKYLDNVSIWFIELILSVDPFWSLLIEVWYLIYLWKVLSFFIN